MVIGTIPFLGDGDLKKIFFHLRRTTNDQIGSPF